MDLGQEDGACFIAMEHVRGPDLGQVLERCAQKGITLPVPHAVFVVIEMLKALEYAHTRQVVRDGELVPLDVVHRDISPPNILLSLQGEVKLTDFGIAKASVNALDTVSGVIKGRFDYMSPEQSAGDPVDPRTDLFATGVVLYQMLTGAHPFTRPSEPATLDAIRAGDFTSPSELNPDVPESLAAVVIKALAVDPDDRWADATAVKEALDRFFHESGFIFTHSTLAAFLRGLFPEFNTRPAPQPSVDNDVTRPIPQSGADPGFADEEAVPTRIAWDDDDLAEDASAEDILAGLAPIGSRDLGRVETQLRTRAMLDDLPDISRSVSLGDVAGLGDESTLIRPNPLDEDPSEDDWSNASTQIRPSPLDDPFIFEEDDDAVLLPEPEEWDDPETRINAPQPKVAPQPVPKPASAAMARPAGSVATRISEPPPPPPNPLTPQAPPPPPSSGTAQVLYILGGALAAAGLVFVGGLLGMQYAQLDARGNTGDTPRVEMVYPAGATVTVNGTVIKGRGPHLLGAGRHLVQMRSEAQPSMEAWITLEPHEYRILRFQTVAETN
jgi:serine/threonine protein kinase